MEPVTEIVLDGPHVHKTRICLKENVLVISGEEMRGPWSQITDGCEDEQTLVKRVLYEKRYSRITIKLY